MTPHLVQVQLVVNFLTKWKNGTWMGNPMLGCKFPALLRIRKSLQHGLTQMTPPFPDYRFTGNTWSGGFAGVYHLPPVNFLGKFTDSSSNFSHGEDQSMPETVQSYIASSAKFENSQIDVSPIATLGTLNKVGYTLSLWAKLNGDVVTATPGLKEYIFDGSFGDPTLIP